jgi:hypothetical protein
VGAEEDGPPGIQLVRPLQVVDYGPCLPTCMAICGRLMHAGDTQTRQLRSLPNHPLQLSSRKVLCFNSCHLIVPEWGSKQALILLVTAEKVNNEAHAVFQAGPIGCPTAGERIDAGIKLPEVRMSRFF